VIDKSKLDIIDTVVTKIASSGIVEGTLVLTGLNIQGKKNILHAIYTIRSVVIVARAQSQKLVGLS